MGPKQITPDHIVYFHLGSWPVSATLVFTWLVMALLAGGSLLATRRLNSGDRISRRQNFLEVMVQAMRGQIREISGQEPGPYLPFVGALFLFIAVSNLLSVVPGFEPPTASLSTTAALALCVFFSVFYYGIARRGFFGYFREYLRPTPLMLPFNIVGEASRTLALAVRLFGNIMSGVKIAGIILAVAPLIFPLLLNILGLLTGMIQAYIFAVLAMVYIASATRDDRPPSTPTQQDKGDSHG